MFAATYLGRGGRRWPASRTRVMMYTSAVRYGMKINRMIHTAFHQPLSSAWTLVLVAYLLVLFGAA